MKNIFLLFSIIFFISLLISIVAALRDDNLRYENNFKKAVEIAVATFVLITLFSAFAGSIYFLYLK